MVRLRHNAGWARQGFALLWDADTLAGIVNHAEVVSLRQFFAISKHWPEDLPAADGNALVVPGIEGCLDVLTSQDAERWIETDLKEVILSFQDFYESQAGLILWLPSGGNRISMKGANENYLLKHKDANPDGLPIGRLLWAGAESDVKRIMNTDDPNADYDGRHWVGLYHPRIS